MVHTEKLHQRIAMLLGEIDDPVRPRQKQIVAPALHQIPQINDEGSLDRSNFDPVAADAFDLQTGLRATATPL